MRAYQRLERGGGGYIGGWGGITGGVGGYIGGGEGLKEIRRKYRGLVQ